MVKRALVIVLASVLAGVVANSVSPKGVPLFGPVPVPEIEGVGQIGLEEAWRLFQTGQAVFVDARSREEYAAGSVPGAILFGADRFEEKISSFLDLIPPDSILVVYCSGEGCESSREVAGLLRDAGYGDVKVFFGGWEQWSRSGHPTLRNAPSEVEDAVLPDG